MRPNVNPSIELPKPTSAALHRLSRGFQPSAVLVREIAELQVAGLGRRLAPKTLRLEGDALLVACEIESHGRSLSDTGLDDLGHPRLEGSCKDGSWFSARVAFVKSLERKAAHAVGAVFSCDDWVIHKPAAKLLLWVGSTDIALPVCPGNLSLSAGDGAIFDAEDVHYGLKGPLYTYYLLRCEHRREGRWLVALEPPDAGMPDRHVLGRDLMSIAFCFGHPFHVDVCHALSADGALSGAFKVGAGEPLSIHRRKHAPVPHLAAGPLWPVAMFEALSRYLARADAREAALVAAIRGYLEALDERSSDGVVLKLLRGALSAAGIVLGDAAASVADADRKRWNDWLSQNRELIEALAGSTLSDELLTTLKRSERSRASAVLRMALSRAGLSLHPDIDAAIASAEARLLGLGEDREEGEETGDPLDERSAAVLRTVLVALVAKAVGYKGRICGWKEAPSRRTHEPADGWWPFESSAADSIERFSAHAPRFDEPHDVRDLWHHYSAPKVPIEGPVAMIASFAEGLEAKTDGLVVANVKPLPRGPRELAQFQFVLTAVDRPTAHRLLFSFEETGDGGIRITDWDEREQDEPLREEAQILSFLMDVVNRKETDVLVQELMILAREPPEP